MTTDKILHDWFVPGEGIDRHVISAGIQRYLGNDATVRPGRGPDQNEQMVEGFWIKAYRNLTEAMKDDFKRDSARWKQEREKTGTKDFQRSQTYQNPTEDARMHLRTGGDSPMMDQMYTGNHAPPRDNRMQGPDRILQDRLPMDRYANERLMLESGPLPPQEMRYQSTRPYNGPDGRSYPGPDGRPYNGRDGRPYNGPDGRPYNGPDSRPYNGPDGRGYPGPDGRMYNGPDGRPYNGVDNRPFSGGPDGRQYPGQDGRPYNGPDGRPFNHHPDGRPYQSDGPPFSQDHMMLDAQYGRMPHNNGYGPEQRYAPPGYGPPPHSGQQQGFPRPEFYAPVTSGFESGSGIPARIDGPPFNQPPYGQSPAPAPVANGRDARDGRDTRDQPNFPANNPTRFSGPNEYVSRTPPHQAPPYPSPTPTTTSVAATHDAITSPPQQKYAEYRPHMKRDADSHSFGAPPNPTFEQLSNGPAPANFRPAQGAPYQPQDPQYARQSERPQAQGDARDARRRRLN